MDTEKIFSLIWWSMNNREGIIRDFFYKEVEAGLLYNLEDKFESNSPIIDMEDYI